MNIAYTVGCVLVGVGCGIIFEAGRISAKKEAQREVWNDANNSHVGFVDDVRGIRDWKRTVGDTAQSNLRLAVKCKCPGCDEASCGLPGCDECEADKQPESGR